MALREFYEMLELRAEDEESLWKKRGLPRSAILAYGLKSSVKANKGLLEKLCEKHGEEVMVEAGLYKKKDGKCRPEAQLCGWARRGKRMRRANGSGIGPIQS
jgi:hypothetical protein